MRLRKRASSTTLALQMTPMIDVVFLLLVFFMTVSQVSQLQRERVQLPEVDRADDQQPSQLTINIRQDGTMVIAGRAISLGEILQKIDRFQLTTGGELYRLQVVIRGDKRSTSQSINRLVRALNAMGIRAVRLAVEVQ